MTIFKKTSVKLTDGRGQTMHKAGKMTLAATVVVTGINLMAEAPILAGACAISCIGTAMLDHMDDRRNPQPANAQRNRRSKRKAKAHA